MKQRKFYSFNDVLRFVPSGSDRDSLRNFNFMNDGQPPSVKALAEKLGFFVEEVLLPDGIDGYLKEEPFAEKGWTIVVNSKHRVTRRRWTVLHEIAHYYLHPRFTDVLAPTAYRASIEGSEHFYATPDELIEEREANAWVEALVFEQNALKSIYSLFRGDVDLMAKRFGVSRKALEIVLAKRRK